MMTHAFYKLADSIEGDKYFDASQGQKDHGVLGHLVNLFPSLKRDHKGFPDRVCGSLAIPRDAYVEIFYPKLRDANWKSPAGEKAHVSAAMAARFLRRLAALHEEVQYEQKHFGIERMTLPIRTKEELFSNGMLRKLWNMSRYPRNINKPLIERTIMETEIRVRTGNLKFRHKPIFRDSFDSAPMAIAELMLADLGWPSDDDSKSKRISLLAENIRLSIPEVRRMFAPNWEDDGVSVDSGPWNKLAWASPQHALSMLAVLRDTGEVSWRMARKRMEENNVFAAEKRA